MLEAVPTERVYFITLWMVRSLSLKTLAQRTLILRVLHLLDSISRDQVGTPKARVNEARKD